MSENALWIVDAPTMATALARTLGEWLDYPVRAVDPSDLPAERCTAALAEILLPDACGLTLAARLRAGMDASVAVWGTRPIPLYAWVAWQLELSGCLDKSLAWEDTVVLIRDFIHGASVWPPSVWRNVQSFEASMGHRLLHLNETDWARWLDLLREESLKGLARGWGLSLRRSSRTTNNRQYKFRRQPMYTEASAHR